MKNSQSLFTKLSLPWVSIYFLLLTLFMTWPLAIKMGSQIVGRIGDNIYFIWMIGWVQKALFELHSSPFDVWFLNYPEGWSLAYTEITPIHLVMALPFSLLGGPIFGYNAVMMLTFFLAGIGMYIWISHLTNSKAAGIIAGTIFAFTPYHFAHFRIGHLNLSGIQWFPFFFMGFFDLLERKDFNPGSALLTGIMLGFIALTSQYYFYMTILVCGFIAVAALLFYRRDQLRSASFWKNVGLAAVVSLPLILVAVAPYVALQQQGGLPDRTISIVRLYSASPTDFILPSTDHFLWGQWVGEHFNRDLWVEATLYLGVVAVFLALVGYFKGWNSQHRLLLRGMLWGGLSALILAMGINLHWNEEPLNIKLPEFLANILGRSEAPLPLPAYLFFYIVPYFAKLRALMRFGIFPILFVAAAAGLGTAWLLKNVSLKKKGLFTAMIIALILLDFYPGPFNEMVTIEARAVDIWLKEHPGQGALVQMPFFLAEDQEQTYYTLTHGKPYVGGFFNAFPPAQYERIRPVLNNFPDQASINLLRELGVEYVLVQIDQYQDRAALQKNIIDYGLVLTAEIDGQQVYEFK